MPLQEPLTGLQVAELLFAATVQTVPVPQVCTVAQAPHEPTGQVFDVPVHTAVDARF